MKKIPGIKHVIPQKIVINSCGTSLDIVSLRGLSEESLDIFSNSFTIIKGNRENWFKRQDAAIVGNSFANRRNLKPGDMFESSGIKLYVVAIMKSDDFQLKNAAFVHKNFLQKSTKDGLGIVTQFTIIAQKGTDLKTLAHTVDDTFAHDTEPTHTRTKQEFVQKTASELIRLISFTHWVGLSAVLAVLALIANTISLAVRGRIRENAILQTIGYTSKEIIYLVVIEGVILGVTGGTLAIISVFSLVHFGNFSLTSEGTTIVFSPSFSVLLTGFVISFALGLIAGLIPAFRAARADIVNSLRMMT